MGVTREPPDEPRWRDLDDGGDDAAAGESGADPAAEVGPFPVIIDAREPREPGAEVPDEDAPGDPDPWLDEPEPAAAPRLPLKPWNPYRDLTPDDRHFVRDVMRFPALTAGIIAVLCFFYAWMVSLGWEFTLFLPSRWGYHLALAFGALEPDLVRQGEWWRLLSPALLHGSLLHLFVNGFMLYQLGRLAENIYGRVGLLVGSAVCGCMLSAFVGDNMSVGASGAVMGLVGACIAFGFRYRRRIPVFLRGTFSGTLVFYAVIILLLGAIPGIDGWGHAGGALGGVLLGLLLPPMILRGEGARRPGWVWLPFSVVLAASAATLLMVVPRVVSFDGGVASEAIEAYDTAMERQRYERASRALDEAEMAEPGSPLIQGLREQLAMFAMIEEDWPLACLQYERMADAAYPPLVENSGWQNNFAWTLFMAHPHDPEYVARGVEVSRASLVLEEDEPIYLNTLAWGLYLAGDYHGALGAIERAMQQNKGRNLGSDVYIYVAALHAVGREAEAIATYRDAVAEHPDGVLHTEVAAILAGQEFGEAAAEVGIPAESATDPAEAAVAPSTGDPAAMHGETAAPDDDSATPDDDSADAPWIPPRASWN